MFNWDIDFYREVQNGDTFKVITEKKFANGEFVGFGRVVAAEYVNLGRQLRGYYFESSDKKVAGYFDNDGKCLEKTFLKNPMEICKNYFSLWPTVSSGFKTKETTQRG